MTRCIFCRFKDTAVMIHWTHEWIFNYDFIKYLNDIKQHKVRKLNRQVPSFINHWTARVMRLTSRNHSLPNNNELICQHIHQSRAETVHNAKTPMILHPRIHKLLYSHLLYLVAMVKSVIKFFHLAIQLTHSYTFSDSLERRQWESGESGDR